MHVEAGLLLREGEVGAHDGEILEHPSQTTVAIGIVDWCAIIDGDLPFGIDWSWCRLAIRHPSAIENVLSVSLLGQVEAVALALDVDTKEEPELTKVLDGELRAQAVNDLLEQRRAGAREHHVIDVQKEVDNVMAASKHEQG
jgi:hypothetical protein